MATKDPDILVDLMVAGTNFEGEVIVKALEAHGIPARIFPLAGQAIYGAPAMSVRVQVRRADLDLARRIVTEMRQDAQQIDWSEVDIGPQDESAQLTRDNQRWVGRLILMILMLLVVLLIMALIRGKPAPRADQPPTPSQPGRPILPSR